VSQSGPHDAPVGHIAVAKDPTPEGEGGFFSSDDEKRQTLQYNHQLAIHDRNLGMIGKITGSTNASLNVAAIIIAALFVALLICIVGFAISEKSILGPVIERLTAAILTVAGFIFGVQQGNK
jgi:uncharacterized membrane protein